MHFVTQAFLALPFVFVVCIANASADQIDEAEAKRRGVPVERVQLERAKEQMTTLQAKFDALQKQLAAMTADLEKARTELTAATAATEAAKAEAAAAKEKLDSLTPGNKLATGEIPEVSAATLDAMGEKHEWKQVRVVNASFGTVDNGTLHMLPGVTVQPDGTVSRVVKKENQLWIGFSFYDKNGKLFTHAWAMKEPYGELLIAMKQRQKVNFLGTVVPLTESGRYGIVCSKIEVVGP